MVVQISAVVASVSLLLQYTVRAQKKAEALSYFNR